ncbi:MAG: TIGR04283 family arsenosugar biosynthesis glycosyltransferase [Candidatus Omnitrophica bacterium]|nr:TIGR04283 family arsenosugar biosynthesis glycosyltransferase [Candidatus Omnitrophota bacterium]
MVSIIIPTYNEEKIIEKTLNGFIGAHPDDIELILADGGSTDRTGELAGRYPVKIVYTEKNRARQMNTAAQHARGDILLFLHADTKTSFQSLAAIERVAKKVVGGCLTQRIDSKRIAYRLIERSGNIRAKMTNIFYGDQAIFVKKDIFLKIGGFDEIELFEDVFFSKKLKKQGAVAVLPEKVYVSPRRWETQGIVKTTIIYWLLTFGCIFHLFRPTLKKIYHDIR